MGTGSRRLDLRYVPDRASAGCLSRFSESRYVTAGLAEPPHSPWKDAYQGRILGSGAFIDRVRAMVRSNISCQRRRESRLIQGLSFSRVIEFVRASYEIDRSELGRRESRHPARAALAYLARSLTTVTNAGLVGELGMSRAESVPNRTRPFAAWLATDAKVRERSRGFERELQVSRPLKLT
jgi:hypothetical protein